MPISDFLDMMPHTITHRAPASFDDYGKPVFSGAAASYRARVFYETRSTVNRASGQDALSVTTVWIAGTPSLTLFDEITLPDGTKPPILNWEVPADESGAHHVKVYFGSTQQGGGGR